MQRDKIAARLANGSQITTVQATRVVEVLGEIVEAEAVEGRDLVIPGIGVLKRDPAASDPDVGETRLVG